MPIKISTARKDWVCGVCHQIIPKGQKFRWWNRGERNEIRRHLGCTVKE